MGASRKVLPEGWPPSPGDGGSSVLAGPAGSRGRTQDWGGGHTGAVYEGECSLLRENRHNYSEILLVG